jgi:hypothetical protein
LVTESHAAEDGSFLEPDQKVNPEKSIIHYRFSAREKVRSFLFCIQPPKAATLATVIYRERSI